MEKQLTVIQMAEYLGVSKEAIYNRLRRGTLQSVIVNGKKHVLLTDNIKREGRLPKRSQAISNLDSDYVDLLKSQLAELKEKNLKLEADKEKLYFDKEKLLIELKEKIEQIYKEKDEQLKAILTLANFPTIENKLKNESEEVQIVDDVQEEDIVEKMCESFEDWQELRAYLDSKGYSKQTKKVVEKRVQKQVGINENVKSSNGELYIKKDVKLKKIIGKV